MCYTNPDNCANYLTNGKTCDLSCGADKYTFDSDSSKTPKRCNTNCEFKDPVEPFKCFDACPNSKIY